MRTKWLAAGLLVLLPLSSCGEDLLGGTGDSEAADGASGETVQATAAGLPDEDFGNGGTIVTDIAGMNDRGIGVELQPDGKIVVCGQTLVGSDTDFLVLRYETDGSLDTSFGGKGYVITKTSPEDESAFDVRIDEAGRIVVAGFATVDGILKFVLVRYLAGGDLDSSFGSEGIAVLDVGDADQDAGAYSLALQGNQPVAAGAAFFGGVSRITVIRCTEEGVLDATFGSGGGVASATFATGAVEWSSGGKAVAIDEAGRIVAGGWVRPAGTTQGTDFGLARFDSDGNLDPSFDADGLLNLDMGNGKDDHIYGLAFQEGKVLAVGNTDNGANKDLAMVRLNDDGGIDSTFADGGRLRMDYSESIENFLGIVVGPSLEIYVGGTITLPTPASYSAVACLDPNGALNASFGSGGFLLTAVDQKQTGSISLALQEDGKIVQAGTVSTGPDNTDVVLNRYR